MHLIDVSNSYSRKIKHELENSATHFIKVYTLGNSRVVFKRNSLDEEIIISNKNRSISDDEIKFILNELIKNKKDAAKVTRTDSVVQISLTVH
ncbi:DUF1827 family protein [Liquorilactobacillus nagelii]|uniref:DUF1827 family protein n=1 Tax=Liquorilactobacillus nagelii TaxID=82688 RepID=UPI001CCE09A2|nr:DUF1827 family protein [Liquorilactobacillus nagelii]ULQ48628.1 DUF1827 family protein [Liquorilactobacillus nagelii]